MPLAPTTVAATRKKLKKNKSFCYSGGSHQHILERRCASSTAEEAIPGPSPQPKETSQSASSDGGAALAAPATMSDGAPPAETPQSTAPAPLATWTSPATLKTATYHPLTEKPPATVAIPSVAVSPAAVQPTAGPLVPASTTPFATYIQGSVMMEALEELEVSLMRRARQEQQQEAQSGMIF
ncbi:hypothetical protein NDU88_006347 [Pleurodeles waltl]|uniref:Uncharacterized protein n=1 Tax=Pleurodeles waltl TaxID=8319 RepID=A0AAV7N371_PLEWA|nr:hypothetical protein NDU88_006347 [Pleurodeles waltl]